MLYLIEIYKSTTQRIQWGDTEWESDSGNTYRRRWRSKYYERTILSSINGFQKITYQQLQQIMASATTFHNRLTKKKGKK